MKVRYKNKHLMTFEEEGGVWRICFVPNLALLGGRGVWKGVGLVGEDLNNY